MHLIRSTPRTAVLAIVGLMTAACGGNAALSSVGPSSASGRASISGIVRGTAVTPTPSRTLSEETFTTLDSKSGVTISVVGTGISTNADNQGQFTLDNVPSGTVVLNFSAPNSNATVTLQGVGAGDRVQITVTVNGNNAHVDSEHHNNGEISARITSIDSGNSSFQAGNLTIKTTSSTVIRHGSKTVAFSDLKPGDHVQVRGTRDGSTVTATEIKVEQGGQGGDNEDDDDDDNNHDHEAEVSGKVSGLLNSNSNSCPAIAFTIGTTKVRADQNTTYGNGTSCSAIKNDLKVDVRGTKQNDGSVLASRISLDD
jgi:Domain of unknown function (DUF5666)